MHTSGLLILIFTAIVVTFLSWRLARGGHPENGCAHGEVQKDSVSAQFYFVPDRPAGPDAEDAAFERDPPAPRSAHRAKRWLRRGLPARASAD